VRKYRMTTGRSLLDSDAGVPIENLIGECGALCHPVRNGKVWGSFFTRKTFRTKSENAIQNFWFAIGPDDLDIPDSFPRVLPNPSPTRNST
jgi:hypothetical protein